MGLIHSYDIYLRPRRVARLLTGMAELAPPRSGVPPLDLTLPGGERLALPFTSRFESEPVDCSGRGTLELDTSLMFDLDDALRAYARTSGIEPGADGRIRIGYIYAQIRWASFLHPDWASVECWAATTRMSRLFAQSGSVRRVFTGLAADSGAVCCLFDTGDGSPEQVCWLNGEPAQELIGGSRFPDEQALVASWTDSAR